MLLLLLLLFRHKRAHLLWFCWVRHEHVVLQAALAVGRKVVLGGEHLG
jgi:hypothetical protein